MADFDVIVVGSGMSGGWVAKEMCEQGFKVAVIERGRKVTVEKDLKGRMKGKVRDVVRGVPNFSKDFGQ